MAFTLRRAASSSLSSSGRRGSGPVPLLPPLTTKQMQLQQPAARRQAVRFADDDDNRRCDRIRTVAELMCMTCCIRLAVSNCKLRSGSVHLHVAQRGSPHVLRRCTDGSNSDDDQMCQSVCAAVTAGRSCTPRLLISAAAALDAASRVQSRCTDNSLRPRPGCRRWRRFAPATPLGMAPRLRRR